MSRLEDKAKARRERIASKVQRVSARIEPNLDREILAPRLRVGNISIRTSNRQDTDKRGVSRRKK